MTAAAFTVHRKVRDIVFTPALLDELSGLVELIDVSPADWGEPCDWPDADILISGWGTPALDGEALAAMPRLRAVFHAAGSVRSLVTPESWARGIRVVTAADANNEPVADYTVAQIVLALKGTHRATELLRRRHEQPDLNAPFGAYGQTIGLVSYGSVARKVRRRLAAFDADVLVWDPHLSADEAAISGVRRAESLERLFAESAVVSIHSPLIPGVTEGMIRAEHFAALRQGATFVNTARGAIVDEPALIAALRGRPDLFAILDVTSSEPPEPESPLYVMPNVLLTGHTAGAIGTERQLLGRLVVDEIRRYLAGEPLQFELTESQAANRA